MPPRIVYWSNIPDGVTWSTTPRARLWEFIQRDVNDGDLPFPDGCADGGRANQVIEHVANPLHFVAEVARVLRPGGVSVATTANIRYVRHVLRLVVYDPGPMTSRAALRTSHIWDDGHVHSFTARDLEWLAGVAGFSRVRTAALISTTGKGSGLRRALDEVRSPQIVKGFLGGNIMVGYLEMTIRCPHHCVAKRSRSSVFIVGNTSADVSDPRERGGIVRHPVLGHWLLHVSVSVVEPRTRDQKSGPSINHGSSNCALGNGSSSRKRWHRASP